MFVFVDQAAELHKYKNTDLRPTRSVWWGCAKKIGLQLWHLLDRRFAVAKLLNKY
jgi:hypothetical protein